jgi:hypothetical protein
VEKSSASVKKMNCSGSAPLIFATNVCSAMTIFILALAALVENWGGDWHQIVVGEKSPLHQLPSNRGCECNRLITSKIPISIVFLNRCPRDERYSA